MIKADSNYVIFTDIDGTLINHHNYDVSAALPKLSELEDNNIPVILNTSKTFAELKNIVKELNIKHPFIVENGSAIFIPKGYFTKKILNSTQYDCEQIGDYWVLKLGVDVNELQNFLDLNVVKAVNFSTCSVSQAIALTGLSEKDARLAQTRMFSIPLSFTNITKIKTFETKVLTSGYKLLKGGRFFHLIGNVDKANSMDLLLQLYSQKFKKRFLKVCLGDSPNDLQMLQQADIPIIVKSPSSDQLKMTHPELIRTMQQAPKGWAEGISQLTLY